MTAKQAKPRRCLCGCNGQVGKRATFVPGHDSKLHSRWLQVRRGESKERLTPDQLEYGNDHWELTQRKPKPKAKKAAKAKSAKRGDKRKVTTKSPATVAAEQDEEGDE